MDNPGYSTKSNDIDKLSNQEQQVNMVKSNKPLPISFASLAPPSLFPPPQPLFHQQTENSLQEQSHLIYPLSSISNGKIGTNAEHRPPPLSFGTQALSPLTETSPPDAKSSDTDEFQFAVIAKQEPRTQVDSIEKKIIIPPPPLSFTQEPFANGTSFSNISDTNVPQTSLTKETKTPSIFNRFNKNKTITEPQPQTPGTESAISHFRRASLVAISFATGGTFTTSSQKHSNLENSSSSSGLKKHFSRTKSWLRSAKIQTPSNISPLATIGQQSIGKTGISGSLNGDEEGNFLKACDYSDYVSAVISPLFSPDTVDFYIPLPKQNRSCLSYFLQSDLIVSCGNSW